MDMKNLYRMLNSERSKSVKQKVIEQQLVALLISGDEEKMDPLSAIDSMLCH